MRGDTAMANYNPPARAGGERHHLDAREVAHRLGGEVWSRNRVLAPSPGHGPKDRSLSIRLDATVADGFIVHSFAGDDWRQIKAHVCERLGLEPGEPRARTTPRPVRPTGPDEEQLRKRQHAQALWSREKPPKGTLVDSYLRARGIELDAWPNTIRFLRAFADNPPCMIAPFAMCGEPSPGELRVLHPIAGVHRTFLKPDGSGKTDVTPNKKMLGMCRGWPIVLAPPNDGLALSICEGIEDALSMHVARGIGAWAAGAAGFMPALAARIPDYIESVTIGVDPDKGGRRERRQAR